MHNKVMPSKEVRNRARDKPKIFKKGFKIKLRSLSREDITSKLSYTDLETSKTPKIASRPLQNSPKSEENIAKGKC